jgi:hypothetical protein
MSTENCDEKKENNEEKKEEKISYQWSSFSLEEEEEEEKYQKMMAELEAARKLATKSSQMERSCDEKITCSHRPRIYSRSDARL